MELLVLDPTEALGNSVRLPDLNFLPDVFGNDGTSFNSIITVAGTISPRALRLAQNTLYWLRMGPSSSQNSGKAVWGTAFSCVFNASTPATIIAAPLGSSGYTHLTLNNTGTLSFLGESTVSPLAQNVWGFFELTVDLDNGLWEVHFNNSLVLSGSHAFSSLRNEFYFRNETNRTSSDYSYFDDFYHLGGTSGPFTDRLGPVRAVRAPLLSTAEANFAPTGAATNLSAVNKTSLAEGSYNRSPASNDVSDRFRIDTSVIPEGKDILCVSHRLYYRKSDIGPRNLDAIITGPSGSNKVSQSLPDRLVEFSGHDPMILTEAPGGGVLDIDALEDMEFGYEVKA